MPSGLFVALEWGDESADLCYTWDALAALAKEWGEDWQERLAGLHRGSPEDSSYVAALISGGVLDGTQPIPFVVFANASYEAFMLAWYGDIPAKAKPSEEEEQGEARPFWKRWGAFGGGSSPQGEAGGNLAR